MADIDDKKRKTAGRRATAGLSFLEHLFVEPVINVKQVEKSCGLSTKAANDLVSLFIEQGILKEISGKTRYRLFLFEPYLNLFK